MTTLFVTEFSNWVNSPGGDISAPKEPAITTQSLLTSASETKTSLFNVATRLVRVSLDSGSCRILFGLSPTVTASTGMRLAATSPEFFGVDGSNMRISAISTA